MHELIIQICFVVAGTITGCADAVVQTDNPYLASQDISPMYVYGAPQCIDNYRQTYRPPRVKRLAPKQRYRPRVVYRHHGVVKPRPRTIHRHRHFHKKKPKVVVKHGKPRPRRGKKHNKKKH